MVVGAGCGDSDGVTEAVAVGVNDVFGEIVHTGVGVAPVRSAPNGRQPGGRLSEKATRKRRIKSASTESRSSSQSMSPKIEAN